MSSKLEYELKSAILSTGMLQPVSSIATSKSISIMCRHVPGQERAWIRVMESLLAQEFSPRLHICKRFVQKDGKMVFGWHIAIEGASSKTVKQTATMLCEYFAEVKPSLGDIPVEPAPVSTITASQPAVAAAMINRQGVLKGMPPPRAPGEPGLVNQPSPPADFVFAKREVRRERTKKGLTVIEEVPIPHVYSELNIPNEKGRGAKGYTES